ncbi:pilus assembly protein CpaD, partial [Mesorhizobium sp. M8A.F.Ca.ET.213.01.1.1]|uniref:CpaD family pilus assembly lipoprotein n=1 Tax=Mesorhizobium sp. M8A.F.Ca.ET.213.01.1.1 TaxID=2563970 RepID=UPI0011393003
SYQNNLAAQMANPADLIGPRKQSDIDAENRGAVIDVYRQRGISDEFLGNSEVTY